MNCAAFLEDESTSCPGPARYQVRLSACDCGPMAYGPVCDQHAATLRIKGHPDNYCIDCRQTITLLRITAIWDQGEGGATPSPSPS